MVELIPASRDREHDRDAAGGGTRADLLASLFQHSPLGVAIVAPDGTVIDANPALCALLGRTRERVAGTRFLDAVHSDDRKAAAEVIWVLGNRELDTAQAEWRLIGAGGVMHWTMVAASAAGGGDDGRGDSHIEHIVIQAQDITPQKRAEAARSAAERRFRTFVEEVPGAIYIVPMATDAAPAWISPQIEAITGYSADELTTDRDFLVPLIHPDDRESVIAHSAETDETLEEFQIEYRIRHRDGHWVWVSNHATPTFSDQGEPDGWQGIVVDISASRAAEEARREAERRYGAIVSTLPAITYRCGPEEFGAFAYEYLSPQASALLGYPDEELQRPGAFGTLIHPDDLPRVLAHIAEADAEDHSIDTYRVRTADGRWIWLRDEAVLLRDDLGLPLYWHGVALDITAEKEAAVRLGQAEARYRSLVQNLPTAVFTSRGPDDPAIAFASDSVTALLGYSPREVVRDPDFIARRIHPEDAAAAEGIRHALATGETWQGEFRVRTAEGAWRWVRNDLRQVRGPDGRPLHWQGLLIDIQPEKEAALALAASEARFRAIFEQSAAGMNVCSNRGIVLDVNAAHCRLLGYTRDEMVGMSMADLTHPDDLERDRELYLAEIAKGPGGFRQEKRYIRKDGSTVWVLLSVAFVAGEDGEVAYNVGQIQDITARKEAEAALAASEALFRSTFEAVGVGMALMSPGGAFLDVNPAMCRIFGHDRSALIGHAGAEFLHPDDVALDLPDLARMRAGEIDSFVREKRFRHTDGRWIWSRASTSCLRDASGAVTLTIGIVEDVSAHKAWEEALAASEAQFRSVFEDAAIGMAIVDAEARTLDANPAFCRMLGYTREEMHHVTYREVSVPGYVQENGDLFGELRRGERDTYRIEKEYLRKDGTTFWGSLNVSAVRDADGRLLRAVSQIEDITAGKEAEFRYRRLVEQIPAAVFTMPLDTAEPVTFISPRIEEITGYAVDELMGEREFLRPYAHPDDVAANDPLVAAAERDNTACTMQYRLRRKDGRWIWLLDSYDVVRDDAGQPLYWQGVLIDVTAEKEAELRYRRLVEQIPAAVFILPLDIDAPPAFISPRIEEITGYRPDELMGKREFLLPLAHPDDVEAGLARIRETDRSLEPCSIQYRMRRKDGRWIWVLDSTEVVRDEAGQPLHWQGVLLDVTAEKEAQQALADSEARFRALVQRSTDAFMISRPGGGVVWVSPAMRNIIGRDLEVPLDVNAAGLIHPDDAPEVNRMRREVRASRDATSTVEVRVRHADGSWRWVEIRATNHTDNPAVDGIVYNVRDLTERKRAEAALADSEALFRSTFEDAGIGMAIAGADGRFLAVNPAFCEMLGYPEPELIAQGVQGITHPEDVGADQAQIVRVLAGETDGYQMEKRYLRKDGSTLWGSLNISAIRDADGALVRVVSQVEDITARKQAEQALATSEAVFRATFHDAAVGMVIASPGGVILDANPAIHRIFGYRKEELIGVEFRAFSHPDDLALDAAAMRRLLAGEVEAYHREKRFRHKDGRWIWSRTNVSCTRDDAGRVTLVIGMVEDISARKAAEAALADSEARFRALVQHAMDVTTIVDRDGDIAWISPSVTEVFGWAPEEVVGTTGNLYSHPDDKALEEAFSRQVRSAPGAIVSAEYRLRHKDGSWRWIECVASNQLEDPAVGGVVYHLREITARKQAEQALAESEALFRSTFDDAAIGMAIVDDQARTLDANPALCRMLGYSREEMREIGFREATAPAYVEENASAVARLHAGEIDSYRLEKEYLRKDGSTFWGSLNASAVRDADGALLRAVIQIEDITARRQAEDALAASEALFRSTFDDAAIGMDIAAGDGRFLDVNPAFREMLGYDHDEFLRLTYREITHPDDLTLTDERAGAMLAGETDSYQVEKRYLRKDGAPVWCRLSVSCVRDADGRVDRFISQVEDISARKAAEAALAESAALFRSAFEDAAVGMTITTPDGRFLDVNPAVTRMFGHAREELIGRAITEFSHPDDHAEDRREMERLLAGETTSHGREKRFRHKDGHWVWCRTNASAVRDAEGRVTRLVGMSEEVSARRAAEAALAESEALFRSTFAGTSVGIAVADPDGVLIDVNPAVERIFGHTRDEVLGRSSQEFMHPDDLAADLEATARMAAGEIDSYLRETRYRHKDGRWIRSRANTSCLRGPDGRIERIIGHVEDISGEIAAAEALAASEARFRALVQHSSDTTIIVDDAGIVTWASPAVEAAFGRTPEDVTGRPAAIYTHPDDREIALALARSVRERPGEVHHAEYRARHEDGGWRWIEVTGANHLADPAIGGIVYNVRDVTERKRSELALVEASELQARALADLRQATAARNEFISFVSHEFRTPLTSISGYAELLAMGGAEDPEEAVAFSGIISREARRLSMLVNDLLLLERADAGRLEVERDPVSLNAVVRDQAEALAGAWPDRRIVTDLDPALPEIAGDPLRLGQVVTNLVANALGYSPDGGPVTVTTRAGAGGVELTVDDEGIGIPEEQLEHVFDRFQRARDGAARAIPGNGLGLAIVRELVTLHGGTVRAERREPRGTRFIVRLPAQAGGGGQEAGGAREG